MVINTATVLGANITSLPVQSGWIMGFPKNFEQLIKADLLRIIDYLQAFRMARFSATNLLICRIFYVAVSITGSSANNTVQLFENGFCAPKTSISKSGGVGVCSC